MFDRLANLAFRQDWQNPQITRQDAFDLTRSVSTPREAIQCYVAICAWGAGPRAWLVGRRARVLRENKDVGERLLAEMLLAENPVASYIEFRHGGENRLLHLGPAFFTKIIYFAAYDEHVLLNPLILDRYVAAAIRDIADLGWPRTWNWTASQYEQYLMVAMDWAAKWDSQPDVVEKTLFRHGQSL